MSLLQRLEQAQHGIEFKGSEPIARVDAPVAPAHPPIAPAHAPGVAPTHAPGIGREAYLAQARRRVLEEVMSASRSLHKATGEHDLRVAVSAMVDHAVEENGLALSRDERRRMLEEIIAEITSFGPIEPLLRDETITEVMVNGPRQVYIERKGRLELTNVHFRDDEHVMRIIDRIIAPLGRRIDESSPRVDARLPDGSRVNAIIAPLSLVGPVITIRKFAAKPYTVDDLVRFGTATAEMFEFLHACVRARLNIFVSGGTGSGKTTTLNVISQFIPEDERIVTIEDAAELQLQQGHVVTLEARPSNVEGEGEITIRQLLRNSLHMRPDRIIVGECRGGEALDMIQAMTVGHAGSLSTGHANTPRDMLSRLETMILMAGVELPLRAIREQIASGVDLIVHTARLKDGSRKIVNITEVAGIDEDEILTQDIFVFEQTAFVDGKVQGSLKPTGVRPLFMGRFKERGIELPHGEFGIPPEDPANPDSNRRKRGASTEGDSSIPADPSLGVGRASKAGGLVFVASVGPIDPATGRVIPGAIAEQAGQCLRNLQACLEAEGSSLDKVVWATWSLRDPAEYEDFRKEWGRWLDGRAPAGQGTVMLPVERRAGFRISIGAIAQA